MPGPVQPEHEQALATTEVERDVLEHRGSAVVLGERLADDDGPTRRGRFGEPHAHRLRVLRSIDPFVLESPDPLLDAVRHSSLRCLGPEAVDDGLQPVDLLRLLGGLLGEAYLVGRPRREVLAVGALVLHDVPDGVFAGAVEVEHASDRLVEQFEVVADDEQGPAVGPEEPEQPVLGVEVEVVRRLVEQQGVRAGEKDAGELDAAALPAGEHPERLVHPVCAKAETGSQRPSLALGLVAALHAELFFRPRVSPDGSLVGPFLHGDAQLLQPHDVLIDPPAGQDVVDAGSAVEHARDAWVLRQVAESALAQDLARDRLISSPEHLEQAGLTCSVATDETDLVLRHDGEGCVFQEAAPAHLQRESRHL